MLKWLNKYVWVWHWKHHKLGLGLDLLYELGKLMKTMNKKIGYWKWADRRCKTASHVCRAYVFEIIFSKNRVFATAKTTWSSFWGAPPMFLNNFLTSTEQGSWTKSCVLQGIVLWTFKTTSEKHERARSLHRRRHHRFGLYYLLVFKRCKSTEFDVPITKTDL